MSGVRCEAWLPQPRAVVWGALTDFPRWDEWFVGVRALSVTPREGGVGAERRLSLLHGSSHRERITAWEAPSGFALQVLDPPFFTRRFDAAVALQEADGGTRVVWDMAWSVRFGALGHLFERGLLAPVLRLALRVSLGRLRRRLAT